MIKSNRPPPQKLMNSIVEILASLFLKNWLEIYNPRCFLKVYYNINVFL